MTEENARKNGNEAKALDFFDTDDPLEPKDARAKADGFRVPFVAKLAMVLLLLALTAAAQHMFHGPLLLMPKENNLILVSRTQLARDLGFVNGHIRETWTLRLPFFETAREVQAYGRKTEVELTALNRDGLKYAPQTISVAWHVNTKTLAELDKQTLIASNGIESLVRQQTVEEAKKLLAAIAVPKQAMAEVEVSSTFEANLSHRLIAFGVRLDSVTKLNDRISDELVRYHSDIERVREEIEALLVEQSTQIASRATLLNRVKTQAEAQLAALLEKNGHAMSDLQRIIDTATHDTENQITENKLIAEADRDIYRMEAQHLRTVYTKREVRLREFLKAVGPIHPNLTILLEEGFQPESSPVLPKTNRKRKAVDK